MPTYPLVVEGSTISADEFVALQYRLWRQQQRIRLNGWIIGGWVLLMAGFLVRDLVAYGGLAEYYTPAAIAFGVVALLVRGPLARRQFRRYYARTPALASATRFELSPEGLRGQGQLSSMQNRWASFTQARLLGSWLLLYVSEASYYYLDLRRLLPPATPADVLALLRAQGVAVREN